MRQHPITLSALMVAFFIAMLMLATPAHAQGVSLPGLNQDAGQDKKPDSASLQRSLDDIIATLEDGQQREQLLKSLRDLKAAADASAEQSGGRQGLLGALADTLTDINEQAQEGGTPTEQWAEQLREGMDELRELLNRPGRAGMIRAVADGAVLGAVWVGLLVIMIALGRLIATRRGWPHDLPRDPRGRLMAIHFFRRMLPWVLSFAVVFGLGQIMPASPGRAAVLVVAYVCVCGRALSVVFETVIAFFSSGHRFTAVRLLQQRALRTLFVIGALIALGDALISNRLVAMLGEDFSGLVSVLANMLAALVAARFIIKFKRPIRHLICNRPYRQRREAGTAVELSRALGGMWHVPALLLVGGSLLAIFISVGDVGTALARSIISASLLVLTLVVTGLLRRHGERRKRRRRPPRYRQYRRRLARVGFVLAHLCAWMVFAELFMQVWGSSLFGIARDGVAGARIGKALLSLGATMLLAWLVWIFADTAIQRALVSSARSQGRRVNQARAQTITPMIRNVIFVTILIIAGIAGLANLGVNVTPLLAGAGVIGLAIGFGAQTLVQDLITGIFILIEDSLAVGDFVEINGHMGTVEGLTLRTVRLRDLDGIVHIITFSRFDSIHNMSRQFGIALMKIRIPFSMRIDDAITLMQETAQELRNNPMMRHYIWAPLEMQGIHAFEEGCPILRMRFRTAPEMQWDVARAFNLLLKQRMEAQEIDLGVPRLSLSMEASSERRWEDGEGEDGVTSLDARGEEPARVNDEEPEVTHRPTPPKPAPTPTRREEAREQALSRTRPRPQGQGEPSGETRAGSGDDGGDGD
ncbi:mechanosensitive ion channel family protein [Halomonas piscis]|uniref:mechanosensitive ion channel family protein n=1 Tax=Halomonas piscis TaxID=3031727 RepID=UPI002897827F|nr:mechanosensitive ion channel family protein [Halomonas piscis]